MTESAAQERPLTRCEACGKRLAHLGSERTIPCPDKAALPSECRTIFDSLVTARRLCHAMNLDWHPETQELLERSSLTLAEIDGEVARRDRAEADERDFRYGLTVNVGNISDWVDGREDRALIVAKWALDLIDMTANGTRNLIDINNAANRIADDIKDHALSLASQAG